MAVSPITQIRSRNVYILVKCLTVCLARFTTLPKLAVHLPTFGIPSLLAENRYQAHEKNNEQSYDQHSLDSTLTLRMPTSDT